MTAAYLTLGQAAPGATTETDLYTVPALTSAIVSTINVCNRSATAATFRISISLAGAATATKDYLFYDMPIGGNDTLPVTIGATMAATDKLRVYASTANLTFQAFGSQIT